MGDISVQDGMSVVFVCLLNWDSICSHLIIWLGSCLLPYTLLLCVHLGSLFFQQQTAYTKQLF